MSVPNLERMLALADETDLREGKLAYRRYHDVMAAFAETYDTTIEIATAVFCALSPNNDYLGNLRSMASILAAVKNKEPFDFVTVSTYRHCAERAWSYAAAGVDFESTVKGPKIRSFYRNILDPEDPEPVTIDGHMVCCWRGISVPMRGALVKGKGEYEAIAEGCRMVAGAHGMIANQLQATLWFTRKRVHYVKYDPQMMFWMDPHDVWGTSVHPDDAPPFPKRRTTNAG